MTDTRVIRPEPYWLVSLAMVGGDQLVKAISKSLETPLVVGPVSFGRSLNEAGVFGLPLGNGTLILIAVALAVGLLVVLLAGVDRPPARLGLWLILGGAVSNLIDRVTAGGVVDVITIENLTRFNLADVMIVLGVLSLIRSLWWRWE